MHSKFKQILQLNSESNKAKGYTLVELIVSIVIISVAFLGMLLAFTTAGRASGNPVIYYQAISIAKSYMEEILAKKFPTVLPCPAAPALRSDYTNVCDYSGLVNNGVVDALGNAIPQLSKFNVSVSVDTSTALLGALTPGSQVVRIDVTVSLPGVLPGYKLSGYRTNY